MILVVAVGALSGCSTTRSIDAQVQSFERTALPSGAAPTPGSSFAMERLPSLPSDAIALQAKLEAVAVARLTAYGMQATPAASSSTASASAAKFSVLVNARAQPVVASANSGWPHAQWGGDWGSDWRSLGRTSLFSRGSHWAWAGSAGGLGVGWSSGGADAGITLDVSVIVRERASGEIVHEAQAKSASRTRVGSADAELELIALVGAALKEFPKALPAPRREAIEIGLAK